MRIFTTDTLDGFHQACRRPTPPSRSALARELCHREPWLNAAGHPCEANVRQVLPQLATDDPDRVLTGSLDEVGPVTLRPVDPDDPADRQAWALMRATHHPLGLCRAPGGQLH